MLGRPEHWILHRLNETVRDVTEALENFDFGGAAKVAYDFVWGEFCDWYIEFSKAALYGENPLAARGLARCWYTSWTGHCDFSILLCPS